MFDICFIDHKQLSQTILDEIIGVKSVAWPYSYQEQYQWIKNNLKDSDIHVLLYSDKKLIAYLNLVEIDVQFDSVNYKGFGIGNVCAAEKGKGWGKVLIDMVNNYLMDCDAVGLLFCKEPLVKFYTNCEWRIIEKNNILIPNLNPEVFTFVYNAPQNFKQIKYQGTTF